MRVNLQETVAFDEGDLCEAIGQPESGGQSIREAVAEYAGSVLMDESLSKEEKRTALLNASNMLGDLAGEDDGWDDESDDSDEQDMKEDLGEVDLVESEGEFKNWLQGLMT